MPGEVRSLSIIAELLDHATKPLAGILDIAESLSGADIEIGVGAETAGATAKFGALRETVKKLGEKGMQLGELGEKAGKKLESAALQVKQAWDPATQSFVNVVELVKQTGTEAEQSGKKLTGMAGAAQSLKDGINGVKFQLLALEGVAGGFMYSAIGSAMALEDMKSQVKTSFGESSDSMLKWIENAENVKGATQESRSEIALLLKETKKSPEAIQEMGNTLEQYFKANRARLAALGVSSATDLARMVQSAQSGRGGYMLNRIFGKSVMGSSEDAGISFTKSMKLMKKELDAMPEKERTAADAQRGFNEAWGEFVTTAGEALLPTLATILDYVGGFIDKMKAIPGVPQFVAIAAAITFLTISMIFLLGTLASSYLAIQKVTGGLRLMTAAQGAFNVVAAMNPYILALIAIVALLAILEYKFHIFSKAAEYLGSIDWSKKWADSIQYLMGLWTGFTGMLGRAGSLLGGGIIPGGANFTTAMSIPGIGPMLVILKLMSSVLKDTGINIDSVNNYLKWIWDLLKADFSKFINWLGSLIPNWLGDISKRIQSAYDWFKGKWEDYLKLLPTWLGGNPNKSEAQIKSEDAAAKALGKKFPAGSTYNTPGGETRGIEDILSRYYEHGSMVSTWGWQNALGQQQGAIGKQLTADEATAMLVDLIKSGWKPTLTGHYGQDTYPSSDIATKVNQGLGNAGVSGNAPSTPSTPAPSTPSTPAPVKANVLGTQVTLPENSLDNGGTPGGAHGTPVEGTGKAIVHRGEEVVSENQKNAILTGLVPSVVTGIQRLKVYAENAVNRVSPSSFNPQGQQVSATSKAGDTILNINIEKFSGNRDELAAFERRIMSMLESVRAMKG